MFSVRVRVRVRVKLVTKESVLSRFTSFFNTSKIKCS